MLAECTAGVQLHAERPGRYALSELQATASVSRSEVCQREVRLLSNSVLVISVLQPFNLAHAQAHAELADLTVQAAQCALLRLCDLGC